MECPPDLQCVLKVENHSKEPLNIRGIFSNVGEIPQLYPHEAGIPGQFHYFIQYRQRESVDKAMHLELGLSAGLRVYPIHLDPHLVEQFRLCKPRGILRQLPKGETIENSSTPTNHLRSSKLGAKDPLERRSSDSATPRHPRSMLIDQCSPLPSLHSTPAQHHGQFSTAIVQPTCRTIPDPNPGVGAQAPLDTSSTSFSMDSRLVMDIQGQQIVYDLAKDREQNPKMVIELLKLSSSERGNWMVAAAHFRRIGKPRAAIEIMFAMLEVLANNGFTEAKLKPVFLLLSGCELDLAICTRNSGDLEASQQHYANVRMWLQKVYGTTLPVTPNQPPSSLLSSVAPQDQPPSKPSLPMKPVEVRPQPLSYPSRESPSHKRRMDKYPSDERNVRRRSSGPPTPKRPRRPQSTRGRYSYHREHWRRN